MYGKEHLENSYGAYEPLDQDALVRRHAPLVKKIAYHLVSRLPASVQVDDLIQAGMLGLLDAATQYKASQGASFETYATIRIRGSMLDELRRNDWAPKSVHKRSRDVNAAMKAVEMRTGRDASDREVAEEMGIPIDEYHSIIYEISTRRMSSFEDVNTSEDDDREQIADDAQTPSEHLVDEQFRVGLAAAIDGLPEREKLIVALYYDEELNLKEIGMVLEVSESRVSQLLSQAHARLRLRMREHTQG
ncbi:MAG: RNA polymerase sigma factor FliA [Gammaproteobacteria bacterium]|nr:RNA polymerase sigma factor FliA [Gammaproteobacteria bacterium]